MSQPVYELSDLEDRPINVSFKLWIVQSHCIIQTEFKTGKLARTRNTDINKKHLCHMERIRRDLQILGKRTWYQDIIMYYFCYIAIRQFRLLFSGKHSTEFQNKISHSARVTT